MAPLEIDLDTAPEAIKQHALDQETLKFSQESCDTIVVMWNGCKKQRSLGAGLKTEVESWGLINPEMTKADFVDSGDYKKLKELIRLYIKLLLPQTICFDDYGKGVISEFQLCWNIKSLDDIIDYFVKIGRGSDACNAATRKEWSSLITSRSTMLKRIQKLSDQIIQDWEFAPEPPSEDDRSVSSEAEIVAKGKSQIKSAVKKMKAEKDAKVFFADKNGAIDLTFDTQEDVGYCEGGSSNSSVLGKRATPATVDDNDDAEPTTNVYDLQLNGVRDDWIERKTGFEEEMKANLKQLVLVCGYLFRVLDDKAVGPQPVIIRLPNQPSLKHLPSAMKYVQEEVIPEATMQKWIVGSLSKYKSFLFLSTLVLQTDLHMIHLFLNEMNRVEVIKPFCFLCTLEWVPLFGTEFDQVCNIVPIKVGSVDMCWIIYNINAENIKHVRTRSIVYDITNEEALDSIRDSKMKNEDGQQSSLIAK